MKKLSFILVLLSSFCVFGQKIQLRPKIGFATSYSSVEANSSSITAMRPMFKGEFNPFIRNHFLPSLEMEYVKNKYVVSVGVQRTNFYSQIYYDAQDVLKIGRTTCNELYGMYQYNLFYSEDIGKDKLFLMGGIGISKASNRMIKVPQSETKSTTISKDGDTTTFTSQVIDEKIINNLGFSVKIGVKYQFVNKEGKDRIGLEVIYNQGLSKYSEQKSLISKNLENSNGVTSFSRGSYLSFMVSYPIVMKKW